MSVAANDQLASVILSKDGGELWLDYTAWHEPHSTLLFRYIIPRDSQPRLVANGSERLINFHDIPKHFIGEARAWLTTNAEVARIHHRDRLAEILADHLEHLQETQQELSV